MQPDSTDGLRAADALERWISHFGISTAVAAACLGTSRRTVARWRKDRRAPCWVWAILDQLAHGPALKSSVTRGRWSAFRDNYTRAALFGPDYANSLMRADRPGSPLPPVVGFAVHGCEGFPRSDRELYQEQDTPPAVCTPGHITARAAAPAPRPGQAGLRALRTSISERVGLVDGSGFKRPGASGP